MENVTLLIVAIAAALVLFLRPRYGLLIYLVIILCYPSYLRIILFGCTFSAGRFVVIALFIRCLLNEQILKAFKWSIIDTLVVIAEVIYLIAMSFGSEGAFSDVLKFRAGAILDTTLAYFSIRLIINNRRILEFVIKITALILFVMALMGVFEAVTTESPYKGLLRYSFNADNLLGINKFANQELMTGHGLEKRFDYYRAQGSHSHPIIFGASFAVLLPIIWKILNYKLPIRAIVSGTILAGGASSMSSTPIVGLFVAVGGLIFERWRRWAKFVFVVLILLCIFVEFYSSKRHFYYILMGKLSFLGGAGYDRARLIDAAIQHLPEYWLAGYGFRDPGWGQEITWTEYTDVCVQYVQLIVSYGIFGLTAYLTYVFSLLFFLWRRYKKSEDKFIRNLCWGLLVSIVVTLIIDTGVAPFGILPTIYYIVFGIAGSVVSPAFERYALIENAQYFWLLKKTNNLSRHF